MIKLAKCGICSREHPKRRIIKKYPLKDITHELPEHLKSIVKEYVCMNIISVRTGNREWAEKVCDNHILHLIEK